MERETAQDERPVTDAALMFCDCHSGPDGECPGHALSRGCPPPKHLRDAIAADALLDDPDDDLATASGLAMPWDTYES